VSKLITPSILDSFKWYKECPASWKEKASNDLLKALKRIWDTPSHAIQRGINFEKAICSSFGSTRPEFVEQFGVVAGMFYDRCASGKQQVIYRKRYTIGNQDYMLYGKADIVMPGLIIDIKTTGSWKGPQTYLSKNQHLAYIAASGIEDFEYLVAIFDNEDSVRPDEVVSIPVRVEKHEAMQKIITATEEFLDFLEDHTEFHTAYHTVFNRY